MRQRMRHAAAVPDDIEALMPRLKVLVELHFHIVEFNFYAIEQRVVVGRTGRDPVERIDHLDNA